MRVKAGELIEIRGYLVTVVRLDLFLCPSVFNLLTLIVTVYTRKLVTFKVERVQGMNVPADRQISSRTLFAILEEACKNGSINGVLIKINLIELRNRVRLQLSCSSHLIEIRRSIFWRCVAPAELTHSLIVGLT